MFRLYVSGGTSKNTYSPPGQGAVLLSGPHVGVMVRGPVESR